MEQAQVHNKRQDATSGGGSEAIAAAQIVTEVPTVPGSNAHTPMDASVESDTGKSELTMGNAKHVGGKLAANAAFLAKTQKAVELADEGNFDSLMKATASEAGGATSFDTFMGVLKEAAGPLAASYGVYSAYDNMLSKANAKGAFESALEKAKGDEDSEMEEIANYGANKIRRAYGSSWKKLLEAVMGFVGAVATLVGGPIVGGVLTLLKGISSGVETFGRSAKGIWKWLIGTRGKARNENADKLYKRVVDQDQPAAELLISVVSEAAITGKSTANEWSDYVGGTNKVDAAQVSSLEIDEESLAELTGDAKAEGLTKAKAQKLMKDVKALDEAAAEEKEPDGPKHLKKEAFKTAIADTMKSQ